MGTEYKIIELQEREISLYEMSNEFDFSIDDLNDNKEITLYGLSVYQLLKIGLKIIKVCSYFMDADELKEKIKQFIDKNIY